MKPALFTRPFYFLRHGETETNLACLIAGSIDTDLTPLGREQALAAAASLAGAPISAVYSSPLRRAMDTARPIAEMLKLPVTIIPELAERSWGCLEGQPRDQRVRGVTPEGAEAAEAFMERVLSGFARIDSETPLIVAHSGVFRVLCRALDIVESEGPVGNAMPLRIAPLAQSKWKVEPA